MSFSTNLAIRPRDAAGSSMAMSTNLTSPPNAPESSQPSTPQQLSTDECDSLRFQIFINLTVLNPILGEKATIHTSWHEGFYYSCVVDGEGRLRYTSLAQNSAEQSLSAVLRLVRGDVEIVKWEEEDIEAMMDEEETYGEDDDDGDGEQIDVEDDESEESDEDDESDEDSGEDDELGVDEDDGENDEMDLLWI